MIEGTETQEADVIKIDTIVENGQESQTQSEDELKMEALRARVEEFSKKREDLMIKFNDTRKDIYTKEYEFVWDLNAGKEGATDDYANVAEYFKRLRAFYDKNVPFVKDEFLQCIRAYEYIDNVLAEFKKKKSYIPRITGEMVELLYSYAFNGTITGLKEAQEKVFVLKPLNNTFAYFNRQGESLGAIEEEFKTLMAEYDDILEKAPPPSENQG